MLSKLIPSSSAPHVERGAFFRLVWRRLLACFSQDDQATVRSMAANNQPASSSLEERAVEGNLAPETSTILLIVHDPALCQWLVPTLTCAEYTVLVANRGMDALHRLRVQSPDLVVIERQLPDVDGLELCRLLHRQTPAPIVMFAPSADKSDTILALEYGADDVIDGVYAPPVFIARVRAVLRRYPPRKLDL